MRACVCVVYVTSCYCPVNTNILRVKWICHETQSTRNNRADPAIPAKNWNCIESAGGVLNILSQRV